MPSEQNLDYLIGEEEAKTLLSDEDIKVLNEEVEDFKKEFEDPKEVDKRLQLLEDEYEAFKKEVFEQGEL